MPARLPIPRLQAVGLDGRPLAGAKLYTYVTGTSTPKATFSDAGLTVPNANPVVADSAGRFGPIFVGPGDYKITLEDSAGTVISTDDPVEGSSSVTGTTLSGPLTLAYANPVLTLNKAASGQANTIEGDTNSVTRWKVIPGNSTAEAGANVGSDFDIEAHTDAGAFLSRPFRMFRSSGNVELTGDLTIVKPSPVLVLDKAASGQQAVMFSRTANVLRWAFAFGDAAAEVGANVGSDLVFYRYDDAGTFIDIPFQITRSTGVGLFAKRPTLAGTGLGVNMSATTAMTGTAVDITGIPSNARRVSVILDSVSTSGTADILIQLGDAGGIETSGYLVVHTAINTATASGIVRTSGFSFDTTAATNVFCGALTLHLADAANNIWVGHGVGANTEIVSASYCAGRKPVSAVLDRIRVTTVGADTFDAGTVTVAWEV